ncbi:MAG: DUF3037 domain-containing protein [Bacteroidia bacterium]|nr:DUF3037 domain-containing protein [Bacteroidia bacterium]
MQKSKVFEYAIIRVVPRVEREVFVNVGVILFCKDLDYISLKYVLSPERLKSLWAQIDEKEMEEHLVAFSKICEGKSAGGLIGSLPVAERFRWLTATRSTMVQCSKVHPGLCHNPEETLEKLFAEMVE